MKTHKKTITVLLTAAVLMSAVFITGCTKLSEAPSNTLSEADAAANKLTITMLLDDVLVLSQDAGVQTIVTSVKTLIETDAATNAATAVTLLRSIETLL